MLKHLPFANLVFDVPYHKYKCWQIELPWFTLVMMIWIPHSRYQVLKRLLWRADDTGVVIKKKTRKYISWLFQQRFCGNKMISVTDFHIYKYWEGFSHKQKLIFEASVVTLGEDVWLYKNFRYTIRSSINKQLILLDLLSLHRIALCHFYASSQTPKQ